MGKIETVKKRGDGGLNLTLGRQKGIDLGIPGTTWYYDAGSN